MKSINEILGKNKIEIITLLGLDCNEVVQWDLKTAKKNSEKLKAECKNLDADPVVKEMAINWLDAAFYLAYALKKFYSNITSEFTYHVAQKGTIVLRIEHDAANSQFWRKLTKYYDDDIIPGDTGTCSLVNENSLLKAVNNRNRLLEFKREIYSVYRNADAVRMNHILLAASREQCVGRLIREFQNESDGSFSHEVLFNCKKIPERALVLETVITYINNFQQLKQEGLPELLSHLPKKGFDAVRVLIEEKLKTLTYSNDATDIVSAICSPQDLADMLNALDLFKDIANGIDYKFKLTQNNRVIIEHFVNGHEYLREALIRAFFKVAPEQQGYIASPLSRWVIFIPGFLYQYANEIKNLLRLNLKLEYQRYILPEPQAQIALYFALSRFSKLQELLYFDPVQNARGKFSCLQFSMDDRSIKGSRSASLVITYKVKDNLSTYSGYVLDVIYELLSRLNSVQVRTTDSKLEIATTKAFKESIDLDKFLLDEYARVFCSRYGKNILNLSFMVWYTRGITETYQYNTENSEPTFTIRLLTDKENASPVIEALSIAICRSLGALSGTLFEDLIHERSEPDDEKYEEDQQCDVIVIPDRLLYLLEKNDKWPSLFLEFDHFYRGGRTTLREKLELLIKQKGNTLRNLLFWEQWGRNEHRRPDSVVAELDILKKLLNNLNPEFVTKPFTNDEFNTLLAINKRLKLFQAVTIDAYFEKHGWVEDDCYKQEELSSYNRGC